MRAHQHKHDAISKRVGVCMLALLFLCLAATTAAQDSTGQVSLSASEQAQIPPNPGKRGGEAAPATDDDSASAPEVETMVPHLRDPRFWISGQANFIFQANPPFHAGYTGPHSLNPNFDHALSRVV